MTSAVARVYYGSLFRHAFRDWASWRKGQAAGCAAAVATAGATAVLEHGFHLGAAVLAAVAGFAVVAVGAAAHALLRASSALSSERDARITDLEGALARSGSALAREREPHSLVEAEVVAAAQKLRVVLSGREADDHPPWKAVVYSIVNDVYCKLGRFGRPGLAGELHPEDNFPRLEDDDEGRRVYVTDRLAELERIVERLREGG
jgi:hypothetical protein